jgi:N-acetyl-anhydromuramyl-L-alanine amidase AmpD
MSMFLTIALSLLITGLPGDSSAPCNQLKIKDNLVTWGHEKSIHPRNIEAIIIHSSYNALTPDSFSIDGVLNEYRQINVSPHYIIDRKGIIYRLVPDREIAYHAGKSRLPDGRTDVNRVSIGIELINTEYDSPTEEQYTSLVKLIGCLEEKYPVKYLLGHSDIAPGRKTDPWNFDWKKLDAMMKTRRSLPIH